MGCRGVAVWVPASEYGGLILGADWAPVGVSLIQEPGGAAQGVHICVHLQGVHLPECWGWEKLGVGRKEGRKEGVRRAAVGGRRTTLTGPQLTHVQCGLGGVVQ